MCFSGILTNGVGWIMGLAESELFTLATAVPLNASDARFAAIGAKLIEWQSTPDGQRHTAGFLAREARVRADALSVLCDDRGVPTEPGAREVALSDAPPVTPALAAIAGLLTWREAQTVPRGGRQPAIAILAGRPGNGKTSAIGRAVARHGMPALFVVARVIAGSPRNGWNRDAWERWTSVDLLAIDELGREEPGEGGAGIARVSALLAERYDNGRATICATNLDAAGFAARYADDRLSSRLAAGQYRNGAPGGYGFWHEIPDGDLRDPLFRAQALALVAA